MFLFLFFKGKEEEGRGYNKLLGELPGNLLGLSMKILSSLRQVKVKNTIKMMIKLVSFIDYRYCGHLYQAVAA